MKEKWRLHFHFALSTICSLAKWLGISVFSGALVGMIGCSFYYALDFVTKTQERYPAVIWLLPAGGLLIVWIYKICGFSHPKGTNLVIASISRHKDIPFLMFPLIYLSTCITHLWGGSAGREGAALQIGGSIGNAIGKWIHLDEKDRLIVIMCCMSGCFSALFGTPIAAAVFSMEMVSVGVMHYSALVPCSAASITAALIAKALHTVPASFPVTDLNGVQVVPLLSCALLAALSGGISALFCLSIHSTEKQSKKYLKNPYLRIGAGGILVLILTLLMGNFCYNGAGSNLITESFSSQQPFFVFLLKMLFTIVTLSAGYKGGEIVPSFSIGAAFGSALAGLLGLPVPLAAAVGMVSVFCGVTNCPITSLLIALEMFGAEGILYYLTAIAISYVISGYCGLYRSQQIVYSKTRPEYIHRRTI